ncbi:sodium/bile acid cotransporter [Cynoglossus semilaevis]|uniref:Hepatic sodium/bile acid cotransporter n=1 Tax=Cynoglossus semilaevis TaxID=244447 RepID=A0A3P8UI19_CYNSE|nr:sodium/bile acid cotransporter [Cynoglossus semilaevis]
MDITMNISSDVMDMATINSQGNAFGNESKETLELLVSENITISIVSLLIVTITMVSLGLSMEISKIKQHFVKPKGPAIAMVSQFGIMPLTAYCLAKVLKFDDIQAVTLLICGCCPGGTLSNIFSLAINGDMNLSIVLTTCSSFAALGMMPLLLYIFSQGFGDLKNAVPYLSIIKTLVLTLVPCGIGIAIKHYIPKYVGIMKKVGVSILVIASVVAIIACGTVLKDLLVSILTVNIVAAAALMPLIGYTLGFVLSVLFRLDAQCGRTISMETGCQNIQLCFAILKVAFPLEVIGPMFLFPMLYMTFQMVEAFLLILSFRCYQRLTTPGEAPLENNNVDDGYEQVKQP